MTIHGNTTIRSLKTHKHTFPLSFGSFLIKKKMCNRMYRWIQTLSFRKNLGCHRVIWISYEDENCGSLREQTVVEDSES